MSRTVSFRVSAFVAFTLGVTALGAFVVRLQAGELPLEFAAGATGKQEPKQPQREWRLIDGKHWQIAGSEGEAPAVTDKAEGNRGACSPGMVEVKGNMKADPAKKVLFDCGAVVEALGGEAIAPPRRRAPRRRWSCRPGPAR